jgi:hypothetical protein
MLIGICGGPGTGKTTLADRIQKLIGGRILHTDSFKELPWADQPDAVIAAVQFDDEIRIVEGVTVARAARRGLLFDKVVALETPLVGLSKGQETMTKGMWTVLRSVQHESFRDVFQAEQYLKVYLEGE